jgi:hypothetical protein
VHRFDDLVSAFACIELCSSSRYMRHGCSAENNSRERQVVEVECDEEGVARVDCRQPSSVRPMNALTVTNAR